MKLRNLPLVIIPIIALAAGALAFSGCTTTTTVTTDTNGVPVTNTVSTLDTNKVIAAINASVPFAVKQVVAHVPNSRQYFQDASAAIALFASTSSDFDPTSLNAAITNAVKGDFLDADAMAAIDAGVGIFKAFWGDALAQKLNTPAWVSPVLTSFALAINKGLTL